MKKFIPATLLLISLLAPFANINADDTGTKTGRRMSTAERKDAIKMLVEIRANGDIVIKKNPAADDSLKAKAPRVPSYLMDLMLHIDPNLDFEKFNKIMSKTLEGTGGGVIHVRKACADYLATNNMRLKQVKFQPNNVKNRIDNGLPYAVVLFSDSAYDKIEERGTRRPTSNDWKEWAKTLRNETVKTKNKIDIDGSGTIWGLIRGYNKDSGEYFIQALGKEFWMTESEVKLLIRDFYEPRI